MHAMSLGDYCLTVWLHTRVDPPGDQFEAALDELTRHRRVRNVSVDHVRSLVVSDGGAPNTKQRAQLTAALNHSPSKLAVVTTVLENPLKRGVATALGWLNPDIRFYVPNQFRDAVDYLGLAAHTDVVWKELGAMASELPNADLTLPLISRATGLPPIVVSATRVG
jgi:hypothetical protein